jgi:hypothetical protein
MHMLVVVTTRATASAVKTAVVSPASSSARWPCVNHAHAWDGHGPRVRLGDAGRSRLTGIFVGALAMYESCTCLGCHGPRVRLGSAGRSRLTVIFVGALAL